MGGSSGGGSSNSTQNVTSTVTQSDIPKEFYPYLRKQMQFADALLQQDYTPYEGQRTAGYTPEQQAAFQGITGVGTRGLEGVTAGRNYFQGVAGQNVPDYLKASSSYTGDQAFGSGYNATDISSSYDPNSTAFGSGYGGSDIRSGFTGANITSDYNATNFDAGNLSSRIKDFQNPYQEMVLDRARDRATKQFDEQTAARRAKLAQAGGSSAFGSRGTLADMTAADNLLTRQSDLEARYLSEGFDKAAGLAGSDLDRALRAAQLSDASRRAQSQMRTGAQEATARFGQAAGAQDIQAQIARDAAFRAAGSQRLQGQQLQDSARRAAGLQSLQAQQATERQRQAQGAQTLQAQIARDSAARSAGAQELQGEIADQRAYQIALARGDNAALRAMEADKLEQRLDLERLGALNALGSDLRAQDQRLLDQRYADFQAQRDYPYQQLSFYSNLLRGNDISAYAPQQTTTTAPGPNQMGQIANFLLGARSLAS